ncbi:MAG: prolipoprotein diacylglyceryl transferase [Planctomycetes bacterium]|nr:prolipoprotein diacylglyceryl transferase [Planctomycetota bacterium]
MQNPGLSGNCIALILDWWVHDLDPYIVRILGRFGVRWYGVAYLLGLILGVWLLDRWRRADRLPLKKNELTDFAISLFLGIMIGGRLGFCFFYAPHMTFTNPLFVFKVWHGGMSSHGGMVGLAVACVWFARSRGLNALVLADAVGAVAAIGVIAGRIANFINGELWGRPTKVPWAVIFPRAPLVDGKMVPRHPSQLYAAALEGVLVLTVALSVHRRHRRPGLTLGVVLCVYSLARFVDEFWRAPADGTLYFGWMSKGQLLTIPVVLVGAWLLFRSLSRPPDPEAYSLKEES